MFSPRLKPGNGIWKKLFKADNVTQAVRQVLEYGNSHAEMDRSHGSMLDLSRKDVHRLNLASAFINRQIQSLAPGSISTSVPFNPLNDKRLQAYGERLLTFRMENWTGILDLLNSFDYFGKLGLFLISFLFLATFVLLPGAYGGVHYAAISIGFPSAIERLLLEISCFFLLGFAALIPACLTLFLGYLTISFVFVIPLIIIIIGIWFLVAALARFVIEKLS
jgi:hypothetical protein